MSPNKDSEFSEKNSEITPKMIAVAIIIMAREPNGIKALQQLRVEYFKRKYKSFPPEDVPRKAYKTTDANGLTAAIMDWLTFCGLFAARINVTGMYRPGQGWTKSGSTKGVSDVIAVLDNGRFLSVEVKIGKDFLSEHQLKAKAKIEECSGLYFVAKDFQSFYDYFRGLYVKGGKA